MSIGRTAVALMGTGGAVAALTQLPLVWDGAYIALNVLWTQAPFAPHERWVNIPLQAPVLLLSRWISDPGVLGIAFSAMYALIPAAALAASWWIVRRDAPHLILWPALSIGLLSLPGQAFFVSEAIFSTQLVWPLLLAAALGAMHRHAVLLGALALLLAVAHPIAVALLGLVLLFALVPTSGRPPQRTLPMAIAGGCLVLVLGLRFVGAANAYETDQISLQVLALQAHLVLTPGPLMALMLTIGSAWLLLLRRDVKGILGGAIDGAAIGGFIGAGALLLYWALDPTAWIDGLEYRGLVLFFTLPLYGAAFADARRRSTSQARLSAARKAAVLVASGAWMVVVVVQGLSWHATLDDLRGYLALSPTACVAADTIGGIEISPLRHWGVTPLSLLVGGQEPARIVLQGTGCGQRLANGFPITGVEVRAWQARWFEMEPLERLIAIERAPTSP